MKNKVLSVIVLFFWSLLANAQNVVDLPIDFDSTNVNYDLVDFGGNASMIMVDPAGGTNNVLMVNKNGGAQTWAGTTIGGAGLATPIPFAPGSTVITMRVYSPDNGIVIRLKVEDPNDATHTCETDAITTIRNAWETLTFDFSTPATGTASLNYNYVFQKLSVFFNFGVDGATAGDKTYYCDDLNFIPGVPVPVNVTFQVQNPDSVPVYLFGSWSGWSNWPGDLMTDIGNGIYSVTLPLNPSTPYEFIYVNGNGPSKEVLDPTWPCTNGNAQYTNRVITTGVVDQTLCAIWNSCNTCGGSVSTQVDLPITFDDSNINYDLVDFGGNTSNIEPDPAGGTNLVCKSIKSNTAQTWAGTTIGGTTGFATSIPFAPNATQISMRIYSPDAGIAVRMKAEDLVNPAVSVETEAITTASNTWETLTFNFANQAPGTAAINFGNTYNKLSVFFNFGVDGATAGTKTYYYDDIQFLPPGPALVNVTFQVQNPDSTPVFVFGNWNGFSNFPGTLMSPVGNGIYAANIQMPASANYEFKYVNGGIAPVLETLDPTWTCTNGNTQYTNRTLSLGANDTTVCAIWASCNTCTPIVLTPVDLPVTFDDSNVAYDLVDFGGNGSNIEPDPAGGTNLVCKSIKSNTAQLWAGTTIGGTAGFANPIPFAAGATTMRMRIYSPDAGIPIRMKAEDPANGAISVETEAITTTSNTWETLIFDFSNQASGTAPINFSNNYQKLSLFFNFGTDGATAGTKTYYYDDIEFGGGPAPTVNVTFQVESPDSLPVFVFGSWSGWSNYPGTLMNPSAAANTYEATITLNANSPYEYIFVNGGSPVNEVLDPSWSCTNGNTQYTNRTLLTGNTDTAVCSVWQSCIPCGTTRVNELLNDRFTVYVQQGGIRINSESVKSVNRLDIYDLVGRTIYSSDNVLSTNTLIPVSFGTASLYVIKITTNEGTAIFKGLAGN